jgi:hypothetical protein
MAATEIESYRQLEQDYTQQQTEYEKAEEAYRRSADAGATDAEQQYQGLMAKRETLERLYDELKSARSHLAQLREEASRATVL